MRVGFFNILLIFILFFPLEKTEASWLINGEEYHYSAHGQLSCEECHSDILEDPNHPSIIEIAESRTKLSDLSENDRVCLECHFVENDDQKENIKRLCAHCHLYDSGANPLIDQQIAINFDTFGLSPHSKISCLECHKNSTEFSQSAQKKTDCLECHQRHHEKVTHDAHIDLSCKICHLQNVKPSREIKNNKQVWHYAPKVKDEYDPHQILSRKEAICSRCHFKNNDLGASDHALPVKSIICMPCHAATFSAGDITSIVPIIILLIGVSGILLIWLSAGRNNQKKNHIHFNDLMNMFKAIVLDGLLQRPLFKVSVKRWAIHAMIFFPLLFRFIWGITALISSLFKPDCDLTWLMLDKNSPITGFLFDFTGMLILAGGFFMVLDKRANKIKTSIRALPKGNSFIHILLGGLIITGFILEGARIAVTGTPHGSEFAFIGYGISRVFLNMDLTGIYAYLWYIHAVITGAFIACLPFSRMFHVLIAPLSLLIKAASKE